VSASSLEVTREQVLARRRHATALDRRLPPGPASLRQAAWAGLQDSMPRGALLSIHARVEGATPSTFEDSSLVQLWDPRHSVVVVAACDRALFSLGLLPDDPKGRARAEGAARLLTELASSAPVSLNEAGRAAGVHPNYFRHAAATGSVLLRWDGAKRPVVWTVPAPEVDPATARLELARRFLHVFGPATPQAFGRWSGLEGRASQEAFDALASSPTGVVTPIGTSWLLAEDEPALATADLPPAPVPLLPSGDTFFLLQGAERELLVPDAAHRAALWPTRVWPGAPLVAGEVDGTWRRAGRALTVTPWRHLSPDEREAVEEEAHGLPLPGDGGEIVVRWEVAI
jgi:hypothetical protein